MWRLSRLRVAVLAGGAALLALLVQHLGPGRILSLLSSLGANILVIVALFACHECVRAVAVGRLLPAGERPSLRSRLRIRFLGEAVGALTRTGPFGAEPVRAWLFAAQAGGGVGAAGLSVSELIANSWTSSLLTAVVAGAALVAPGVHGPLRVVCHVLFWSSLAFVGLAVGALTARVHVIGAIAAAAARVPILGRRLTIDPVRVRSLEDGVIHALTRRPSILVQIVSLELIAQAILVAEIYWTIRSMGVPLSAANALFIEVISKAANMVQFVGVTEAGYTVLFDWLGLTGAVGFALSLVKVVRSVITALLGLAILNRWNGPDAMLAASYVPPREPAHHRSLA